MIIDRQQRRVQFIYRLIAYVCLHVELKAIQGMLCVCRWICFAAEMLRAKLAREARRARALQVGLVVEAQVKSRSALWVKQQSVTRSTASLLPSHIALGGSVLGCKARRCLWSRTRAARRPRRARGSAERQRLRDEARDFFLTTSSRDFPRLPSCQSVSSGPCVRGIRAQRRRQRQKIE